MPTRQETTQRKHNLMRDLRALQREGRVRPGANALSQRELAQKYGVSVGVVGQTLQTLIGEGVLYTIPRVGTFIGAPPAEAFEFFLFLFPHDQRSDSSFFGSLQSGFEEVIAGRGGASLTMTKGAALEAHLRGELPPVAGMFSLVPPPVALTDGLPDVPRVCFESDEAPGFDIVSFDNVGGGRVAAQHLLKQGHERIAFLGVHDTGTAPHPLWSHQREIGWREALEGAGCFAPELAWHPAPGESEFPHTIAQQTDFARQIAARHVRSGGLECGGRAVSAVVSINYAATLGLLQALRAADVPPSRWPAIVGFGNTPDASGHVFTSLHMPWDEVGRTAAKLLWARRTGELSGLPVGRDVSMRLIPRLTCRTDWSLLPGHAALAVL